VLVKVELDAKELGMNSRSANRITSAPFAAWLGVFVVDTREGEVALQLPYRDEFGGEVGQRQISRSVIAALADLAGQAVAETLTEVDAHPRAPLHVEYLRGAAAGNELRAEARVAGASIQVEIRTNDDRTLIARATAPFSKPLASTSRPTTEQPIYPN
jgi:uncharacterized protein (TIGR00369 family)